MTRLERLRDDLCKHLGGSCEMFMLIREADLARLLALTEWVMESGGISHKATCATSPPHPKRCDCWFSAARENYYALTGVQP